jgi:cyclomaltodextrinase / maltogenic alpha-amylase / neopullulanase
VVRPGRGRLAARRRLRRPARVLARRPAARPRAASRALGRRRGHPRRLRRLLERSGVDSVTQYELWKAIWSSLNDRNLFELAHALRRHGEFARTFLPQTFVGNHDVTRLASRLTDARHARLALALLCTLPGVPTVYYGDEWALRGVKEDREGGDDAVRPAFPPTPEPPTGEAAATEELHRRLIAVRRRNPWLAGATIAEPDVLTNDVLAVRLASGADVLAVVLNVGDTPAAVRLPFDGRIEDGEGTVTETEVRVAPHAYLLVRPR